jgi:hypothetical protein
MEPTNKKPSRKSQKKASLQAVEPMKLFEPAPKAEPVKSNLPKAGQKVSPEERMRMIEQAAYFRSEKSGFKGDPHEHWAAAEAEIDAMLAQKK